MALPPTIPTSFVPHSSSTGRHFRSDYSGAFGFFAYAVLGVVLVLSIGLLLYGRILATEKASQEAKIATALQSIDPQTIEGFVRLRDRLVSSQSLLGKHVAFTSFFSTLAKIMPAPVRFTSLNLSFDGAGIPTLEASGVAKNFNALAATSEAFAKDGRVKDAIFSHLNVNKDNSVSFVLAATLDSQLITFSP